MSATRPEAVRTVLFTGIAMVFFAANSVLCRLALARETIDAAGFAAIRLGSGALALLVLSAALQRGRAVTTGASLGSALALFTYAAAFAFAYTRLPTGIGALILFGLVQLSMIGWGLVRGERLAPRQWLGFVVAILGLLVLTAPGLAAPDPLAALLMAVAGVAWGVYSIRGRGVAEPLPATAGNFLLTLPLVVLLAWEARHTLHASPEGIALALTSGALASGVGYAVWYAALRGLRATQAAIVQLSAPVIAAAAGVALLAEPVTPRLVGAGVAILAGVALSVVPAASRSVAAGAPARPDGGP